MHLKSLSIRFFYVIIPTVFALQGIAKSQELESIDFQSFKLMLIGGQLEVCSNKAPQFCQENVSFSNNKNFYSQEYELSETTLNPVTRSNEYHQLKPETKSRLDKLFEYFYNNPKKIDSINTLDNLLQAAPLDFDAQFFFDNLPIDIYYAIIDFANGSNTPKIIVELDKSRSLAAKEILVTFVKQAQLKRKPGETLNLGFLTSSQRNPFEQVSWYQQALLQAAKMLAIEDLNDEKVNINWIPLDKSLMHALEIEKLGGQGCEELADFRNKNHLYNAAARYPELTKQQRELCHHPEKIESLIKNAHGIFIADADFVEDKNSLATMRLFRTPQNKDTIYKKLIKQRFYENQLFMAGNGDGARILSGGIFANRPVPLITGGTGSVPLFRGAFALPPVPLGCEKQANCPYGLLEDDLTFENMGGLGLFSNGIVDTHFSKQDRHARLTTLAAVTKTRFGFGIDTNTAMLVTDKTIQRTNEAAVDPTRIKTTKTITEIRVLGDQGVHIIDMNDGIVKTQSGKHQIIGLSHNLNHDDAMSINNVTMELTFSFSPLSKPLNKKGLVIPMNDGEYHRNVSFNCGTTRFHRWNEDNIAWLINPGEDTRFLINRNQWGETCSYNNLLFGVEN